MEQISIINEKYELSELVTMRQTELYNFFSRKLRSFISERTKEPNHNITLNNKTTLYMGSKCFDSYTIEQIINRLNKIYNEITRFHNEQNILELDFFNTTKQISLILLKGLNILNLKELADLGLSNLYEDHKYIYNEVTQKSRKTKVYRLHFNLDVTKELGFINPQQVNN